jgi:hypothetical protein
MPSDAISASERAIGAGIRHPETALAPHAAAVLHDLLGRIPQLLRPNALSQHNPPPQALQLPQDDVQHAYS